MCTIFTHSIPVSVGIQQTFQMILHSVPGRKCLGWLAPILSFSLKKFKEYFLESSVYSLLLLFTLQDLIKKGLNLRRTKLFLEKKIQQNPSTYDGGVNIMLMLWLLFVSVSFPGQGVKGRLIICIMLPLSTGREKIPDFLKSMSKWTQDT